ncbi:hypothetical protein [Rhodoblastus sp.]|uniref:hypothetical protein n=1 Tax=Rhodoblastus sp. TaxID=1962975 RepID=UPI0035B0C8A6
MKQIFEFVKTTVLGGIIFLLPFAATILVVVKVGKMAVDGIMPLAEHLPIPKTRAVIATYAGGTILLVLVGFAAGIFVQSRRVENQAAAFLEGKILKKLPPYVALGKYADRLTGLVTATAAATSRSRRVTGMDGGPIAHAGKYSPAPL